MNNLQAFLTLIGHRIRIARKGKRLSQEGLARLSGVDRAHISIIECGRGNPAVGTIFKIANALECPAMVIFHKGSI